MLNDLALTQSSHNSKPAPDAQPIPLPRVSLRFLARKPRDLEALFGIPDLPLARRYLREQLFHRGIREEVLTALDLAPRHVFVAKASLAYVDLAILSEHTIVQAPGVVATVCSTLSSPDAQVLELGTGTGYQSAVLAAFGAQVTTIDSREARQQAARERFEKLDLSVVMLNRKVDPLEGLEGRAKYDLVVVNDGLQCMPCRLIPLLREEGGSIIAPILLADGTYRLMRYRRNQDQLSAVDLGPCFAPSPRPKRTA